MANPTRALLHVLIVVVVASLMVIGVLIAVVDKIVEALRVLFGLLLGVG